MFEMRIKVSAAPKQQGLPPEWAPQDSSAVQYSQDRDNELHGCLLPPLAVTCKPVKGSFFVAERGLMLVVLNETMQEVRQLEIAEASVANLFVLEGTHERNLECGCETTESPSVNHVFWQGG
mmetsp:Transcript_20247/g.43856  ORF Transcript_20247/g.43856 Transcript_20247/m.43856 type:complete len:122 (+) Transcript_20247:37-402(+)